MDTFRIIAGVLEHGKSARRMSCYCPGLLRIGCLALLGNTLAAASPLFTIGPTTDGFHLANNSKSVGLVVPLHVPKYHFGFEFLDSAAAFTYLSDFQIVHVFSSEADMDLFVNDYHFFSAANRSKTARYSFIVCNASYPAFNSSAVPTPMPAGFWDHNPKYKNEIRLKTIVSYKKLLGLLYLFSLPSPPDYALSMDSEIRINPVGMEPVEYARRWAAQQTVLVQGEKGRVTANCQVVGIEANLGGVWWNDAPLYMLSDFADFLDRYQWPGTSFEHWSYLCYKIHIQHWKQLHFQLSSPGVGPFVMRNARCCVQRRITNLTGYRFIGSVDPSCLTSLLYFNLDHTNNLSPAQPDCGASFKLTYTKAPFLSSPPDPVCTNGTACTAPCFACCKSYLIDCPACIVSECGNGPHPDTI